MRGSEDLYYQGFGSELRSCFPKMVVDMAGRKTDKLPKMVVEMRSEKQPASGKKEMEAQIFQVQREKNEVFCLLIPRSR